MEAASELDGMLAYTEAIKKKDRNDPNWPLPSFDARDWAEAFCQRFPEIPEDAAITWFANALMRGYDEYSMRSVSQ